MKKFLVIKTEDKELYNLIVKTIDEHLRLDNAEGKYYGIETLCEDITDVDYYCDLQEEEE